MKVSVIIPAFNEEKYISNCLKSVFAQNELPDEVIVVNNNSTDSTVKLASKYPVKITSESKQGILYARNTGFSKATGDVIARCDADTILPKNWIEEIKKKFQDKTVAAISGPVYYYDAPFFIRTTLYSKIFFNLLRLIQGHNTLLGFNMAVRKDIWEKIKDEVCLYKDMHEDTDLAFHICKVGKIIYDPSLVVSSSARRILKNPRSFFITYPYLLYRTFKYH